MLRNMYVKCLWHFTYIFLLYTFVDNYYEMVVISYF